MASFKVTHCIAFFSLIYDVWCQTAPVSTSSGSPGSPVETSTGTFNAPSGFPGFGSPGNSFGGQFFQNIIPPSILSSGDANGQSPGTQGTPFYNFPQFLQFTPNFGNIQPSNIAPNNAPSSHNPFPINNFLQHNHPGFLFGGSSTPSTTNVDEQVGPSERFSEKLRALGLSPFGQGGRNFGLNAGQDFGSIQQLQNSPPGAIQSFGASTQTVEGTDSSKIQAGNVQTQIPTVGFYGSAPNIGTHVTDTNLAHSASTQTESSQIKATLVGPNLGSFGFLGNFEDFSRHFSMSPPHFSHNIASLNQDQQPPPVLPIPSYKVSSSEPETVTTASNKEPEKV